MMKTKRKQLQKNYNILNTAFMIIKKRRRKQKIKFNLINLFLDDFFKFYDFLLLLKIHFKVRLCCCFVFYSVCGTKNIYKMQY